MRSHVDLPTLTALQDEWQEHPPVHHLVAAYLGYKPPQDRAAESEQTLQALMSSLPVNTSAPKLDESAWQQHIADNPEPIRNG